MSLKKEWGSRAINIQKYQNCKDADLLDELERLSEMTNIVSSDNEEEHGESIKQLKIEIIRRMQSK